jgi:uncharacterized membrane protein YeaQ/YmgE (transglycosylase-associated protein family)
LLSIFDFLTVACFLGVVGAFVFLTERDAKTLARLLVAAVAFAVANQLGNAGQGLFATLLIGAGVGYAILVVVRK